MTDKQNTESFEREEKANKPGLGRVILSVFAAAIGVQNRQNLERDFTQSSPLPYIFAGVIFTVVFLATLIFIVSFIVGD